MMKNILCFGDSNTFGTNPEGGRHPRSSRWTGILQQMLGEEYYVIEEGMGGRTTIWNDPLEPNRCGIAALPISLQTHKPLDLVIIMLGTNDCKSYYQAPPGVIGGGMANLCKLVKSFDYGPAYPVPDILIVSPILVGTDMSHCPYPSYDGTAGPKSACLAKEFKKVAEQFGCLFFDASSVANPSEKDQLHMDAKNHKKLAEGLYQVVKDYFKNQDPAN